MCGGEIACVGKPPRAINENFIFGELWIDIFSQTKPSMMGYSGIDLVQLREFLAIYKIELDEDLYHKIKYIENKYIKHFEVKEE